MIEHIETIKYSKINRLAVILPSLAGGGIERMRIHLIREWIKHGIEVDLVVSFFKGPLCSQIPKGVQVFEIAGQSPIFFPFGLRRYIKYRKPSHIVSAPNDISAFTLLTVLILGCRIPTVISVHNHLSSEVRLSKGLKRIKIQIIKWMLRYLIKNARGIIAVSQGVSADLKKHFPLSNKRLHVVYNPVITPEVHQLSQKSFTYSPVPEGSPWIIYAGRFTYAKGLDVLLKAFKLIIHKTEAHLVLLGEGPLEPFIRTEAKAAGLESRVHLVGFQPNPLPWIRHADVLVLPSRHEGLGNVLIEALFCGTQIVSTNCPSGPSEILENGKYGQLVPVGDTEALCIALSRSLRRDFFIAPTALQKRAKCFSSEHAASSYIAILETGQININKDL